MSIKRYYIGNMPYTATEADVHEFFKPFAVSSVKFVYDRETNKPRGFGFADVECDNVSEVVSAKDGQDMLGRTVTVNEAKPQEKRGGGGGGGGRDRGKRDDRKQRRQDNDEYAKSWKR